MTVKFALVCEKCGKELETENPSDTRFGEYLYRIYKTHGWTCNRWNSAREWYCPDCKPRQFMIKTDRHPVFHDAMDSWMQRSPESRRSKIFEDEPFDRYASSIHCEMCRCCKYMKLGYEGDGSAWQMCMVAGQSYGYGHNLYSGHFYGAAIDGRFCPYFTCGETIGRDPEKDRKNGTFHVPYDECYDGD